MGDHRGSQWDDEPFGDLNEGKRRTWRRPWNVYLCFVLGAVGLVLTLGGATSAHGPGTLGGLCVLAAAVAVVRADGPRARPGAPPPPPPTRAVELTWYAVAAVLVAGGLTLTSV